MLNIKVESVISQLVRQELIGRREDEALYFNLDCRMSYHSGATYGSYYQSCGLHLLYHVRPGYSYITVFSGVTESPFASIKQVTNWKHECTHDTCWRDISVFSAIYFDMAKNINRALLQDKLEQVAPKEMCENNSFTGFNKAFDWKKVHISTDPADENRYRKVLKLL